MPARDKSLPEGTDHIVNGAMKTRADEAGTSDPGGFVASTTLDDDTGGTAMTDNRDEGVRGQFRQGVANLTQQAGGRIREAAGEGKARASDALDELSRIVEEAAESIEDRFGAQYSPYARRAAEAVGSFATTLREREVDELYDDVAGYVKKSPAVAVGIAAALGFVAIRLIKAGLPEARESASDDESDEPKRRSSAKA